MLDLILYWYIYFFRVEQFGGDAVEQFGHSVDNTISVYHEDKQRFIE